jgi:hypothetical protein
MARAIDSVLLCDCPIGSVLNKISHQIKMTYFVSGIVYDQMLSAFSFLL